DGGVLALGILAHHPEIDVTRLAVGERRRHARHQPDGAQIDVLVELAPEFYQRTPQRDVVRDFRRPADRAEIDRIVHADLFFPVGRHHLAVLLVIVIRGEVEMIELHGDTVLLGRRLDDAQALGHHFLTDAVAGDDRDAILLLAAHRELPCDLPGRERRLFWMPCNEPIFAAAQRCSAMLTAPHSPYSFPPSLP